MEKGTQRETLLTHEETVLAQQRHEELEVEECCFLKKQGLLHRRGGVPEEEKKCGFEHFGDFYGWNQRNVLQLGINMAH